MLQRGTCSSSSALRVMVSPNTARILMNLVKRGWLIDNGPSSPLVRVILVIASGRYNLESSPHFLASATARTAIATNLPKLHISFSATRPSSPTRIQSTQPRPNCRAYILVANHTRSRSVTMRCAGCQRLHGRSCGGDEKHGGQRHD